MQYIILILLELIDERKINKGGPFGQRETREKDQANRVRGWNLQDKNGQ